jgi:hypothetical protein
MAGLYNSRRAINVKVKTMQDKFDITDPATIYTKQLTINIITVIMNGWKRQI